MIRRAKTLSALSVFALVSGAVAAQDRPTVGPEKPFQLAPRIEKTLPNGLRVIVTKQSVIPKVTVTLTMLTGYSSDPADQTGLAQLTSEIVQEGTKTLLCCARSTGRITFMGKSCHFGGIGIWSPA